MYVQLYTRDSWRENGARVYAYHNKRQPGIPQNLVAVARALAPHRQRHPPKNIIISVVPRGIPRVVPRGRN